MTQELEQLIYQHSHRHLSPHDSLAQAMNIRHKPDRQEKLLSLYRQVLKGNQVNRPGVPEWHTDYINEQDRHLGDFVIVFPEPSRQKKREYMRLNDCLDVMENGFKFEMDQEGQQFKGRFEEAFLSEYDLLERLPQEDSQATPYSPATDNLSSQLVDKYRHLHLRPHVKRRVQGA